MNQRRKTFFFFFIQILGLTTIEVTLLYSPFLIFEIKNKIYMTTFVKNSIYLMILNICLLAKVIFRIRPYRSIGHMLMLSFIPGVLKVRHLLARLFAS